MIFAGEPIIACANPRHPDGAWHPAAPLPPSWQRRERLRQWWRKRQYGCRCPVGATYRRAADNTTEGNRP